MRQDRVNRLGLARLNNSGRLWEGAVPRCLVPGLGLIQGRENTGLVCEGLIKEMAGEGVGSGPGHLHMKSVLQGEP